MKIYTNELGHMTAMPIYGKNLQKSSSSTESVDLETLYLALPMQVLPRLFKL